MALCRLADSKGLGAQGTARGRRNLAGRLKDAFDYRKSRLIIALAAQGLAREYDRVRRALGGTTRPQLDQAELRRLAQPFFNYKTSGGEGHLEVSKTIYYATRHWAHMVLSVKPFGCLPSTQSDGAQAAVLARYPEINFISIETSGEGDVNAYSRIQMALGEAKAACKAEFAASLAKTGYTLEDIRAYCAAHRNLRRPLQHIPQHKGVCGKGANFIMNVAARMDADPAWRGRKGAGLAGTPCTPCLAGR